METINDSSIVANKEKIEEVNQRKNDIQVLIDKFEREYLQSYDYRQYFEV